MDEYNFSAEPVVVEKPKFDVMGLISLICGIVGLVSTCCYGGGIIPAIVALILGGMSKKKLGDASASTAKVGKILGIIGVILNAIALVVYCAYFIFVIALGSSGAM